MLVLNALNAKLYKKALIEACIVGAIGFILFGPMVGLRTVQLAGGLGIYAQWQAAFAILIAAMIGRFFYTLMMGVKHYKRQQMQDEVQRKQKTTFWTQSVVFFESYRFSLGAFLLGFVFALPFILMMFADGKARYLIDISILVLTYIMLGWGLNIVVGLAGLLDLGYVAFYAVGAYSYALLALHFDLGFWVCLPLAGILAGFWGMLLGFPVLRLRGDYLAIVTLAFGEIIRVVLLNWYQFTGGPDGLSRIPRPSFFGLEFSRGDDGFAAFFGLDYSSLHRIIFLYYIILILALLTHFVSVRLRHLPIGRAWEALREDEIACRSLGINTTMTKLTAFSIGAMFGGFAGAFFATRQGFISPESFSFIESAIILAIVVLGGLGSQLGVVIASIFMIGGFEVFREFEEYRMMIFGLLMVFIMVWRPRGLISERVPSVFLKKKKAVHADYVSQGAG